MLMVNQLCGFGAGQTAAGGGGGGPDPDFASVVLLSSFDGADGATTATDDSNSAHALSFVGNAQIDTAVTPPTGTGSLLLDGTGDGVLINNSADFQFGSGAFTIDLFLRHNSLPNGDNYLVSLYDSASQRSWALLSSRAAANNNRMLNWLYATVGTTAAFLFSQSTANWVPVENTFYHVRVDRDGSGVLRIYAGGVMVAKATNSVTYHPSTGKLAIGGLTNSGALSSAVVSGHISELRITKGVARCGSDAGFTVPAEAYPRT